MATSPSDLEARERELNQLILDGRAMEAFERFYADDVIMQENNQQPTAGKEANRVREQEFFRTITQFHGVTLHAWAVGENVTMSEWSYDATYADGTRRVLNEVSRRLWRDGRVIHEKFYYSAG